MRNQIFTASNRLDFAAKVNLGNTGRRLDRAIGIRVACPQDLAPLPAIACSCV
ncbi:hypothetical protein [Nodularia spumigena]|uniref:Uncharacterized protein n=1 Tax=Nodularia spumigena UHCC 0060 TaxID=3110300 RepID=A0ABU5UVH0_NODSP|nr:hypothetical protein [Nodularia spumigena]MEA5527384.1 hypothetical protein [Nodularia spumigena UHCC 0143]MEA5609789.1 hypothetical protein [Nodularia spumigena UHCC 0060]MEA5615894.1 hypothetical protein [Nodularia spumigena UHCC 0040]